MIFNKGRPLKKAKAARVFKDSDFQVGSNPQEPALQSGVIATKGPVTQEPSFRKSGAEKDLNNDISPKSDKQLALTKEAKF